MHIDVCGPMQSESFGETSYFLNIFIDDRTKFTWVYFIRKKNDGFEYFEEFRNTIKKQILKHIKVLRLDQGGEYTSRECFKYYKYNGIKKQCMVSHIP